MPTQKNRIGENITNSTQLNSYRRHSTPTHTPFTDISNTLQNQFGTNTSSSNATQHLHSDIYTHPTQHLQKRRKATDIATLGINLISRFDVVNQSYITPNREIPSSSTHPPNASHTVLNNEFLDIQGEDNDNDNLPYQGNK